MRLTGKLVDDVITEVAGEDTLGLVKQLKNKKNVSEFKLAEKLKLEVNSVRNMLYRLYHANLVSFIRKKDKKKGWYIYYWTFNLKRIRHLALDLKKKRVERLKDRLKREEEGNFYLCPNQCMRLDFDQATEFNYKCPECGQLMDVEDNSEKVKKLKAVIKKLEQEMKKK